MNRLIEEMVDLTRIDGEVFQLEISESVNIVELIRQVVEQYGTTTQRTITLEAKEAVITASVDENRLEQVLSNLINNALKYSKPDTSVVVGIEHQKENEVVIWVRDEGEGISEEEQPHVFDRFYRARMNVLSNIDGLGLGLYIASEIVKRMGGRIWLESSPGKGSTFFISLPLERQAP